MDRKHLQRYLKKLAVQCMNKVRVRGSRVNGCVYQQLNIDCKKYTGLFKLSIFTVPFILILFSCAIKCVWIYNKMLTLWTLIHVVLYHTHLSVFGSTDRSFYLNIQVLPFCNIFHKHKNFLKYESIHLSRSQQ